MACDDRQRPFYWRGSREHWGLSGRGAGPARSHLPARPAGKIFIVGADPAPLSGLAVKTSLLRPSRNELVVGTIQGKKLKQYDFTAQQYEALAKLAATLCRLFPKIRPDYPRDADGYSSRRSFPTRSTHDIKASWATITCRPTRSIPVRHFNGKCS